MKPVWSALDAIAGAGPPSAGVSDRPPSPPSCRAPECHRILIFIYSLLAQILNCSCSRVSSRDNDSDKGDNLARGKSPQYKCHTDKAFDHTHTSDIVIGGTESGQSCSSGSEFSYSQASTVEPLPIYADAAWRQQRAARLTAYGREKAHLASSTLRAYC